MRTANNLSLSKGMTFGIRATFLLALGGLPLAPLSAAWAAEAVAMPSMPSMPTVSPPPMPVTPAAAPMSQPGMSGIAPGTLANGAAPPLPGQDPASGGGPNGSLANADPTKSGSALADKVADNAKALEKRLYSSTDSMTLEDLNSAKQTIARIDTMIEVEKRLADLEKIRSDRSSASNKNSGMPAGMASAVPASALAPMPLGMPPSFAPPQPAMPSAVSKPPEKPKSTIASTEISRISGAEGKYSAVLKMGNGELKTVRVGDTISDHATVRWISSSSVLIEENGETHTLHIKNVDAIFSAMR